jgi:hypothetical protein
MDLVPGGYYFMHAVFWSVMALAGVGMMTVATILVAGLGVLFLESIGKA